MPSRAPGAAGASREWAAVGTGFAVLALVAAVWLALDRRPPEWDHANHLERSVHCARDLGRADLVAILDRSAFYPPLVPCAAGLFYRLVPTDVASQQASVLGFLALGMAATYLLARRFGGGAAGVAAALVFGSAPLIVYHSLRFQLDLPLAAMVAAGLAALGGTEQFRHRARSLAVGLLLGLGMLTKPPFLLYVLPGVALTLLGVRGRRAAVNAGAAVLVAAALSLPWYGPRLLGIPLQIATRSFKQAAESGYPPVWTGAALAYYPSQLPTQFGLVASVLCGLGLVVACRRRAWVPLASLLLPLAVVFLIRNKNLRYVIPILPMAAVCAGLAFAATPRRWRVVPAVALAAAAALQIGATVFGLPSGVRIPVLDVPLSPEAPPLPADWRQREILALITREDGGRAGTVSVVPNHAYFSVANFRYFGLRDGLPLRFARAWDREPLGIEYMVLKSGDVGPPWTADKPRRIAERLAGDRHLARVFPEMGRFDLPDGSVASVRVRRIRPPLEVLPARLARAVEEAFRRRLPEIAGGLEGLEVRLSYDARILEGRVRSVEVLAARATLGDLRRADALRVPVRDVRVTVDDVLVNPFSAWEEGRLDPLDIGRVRLERATITAEGLAAIAGQARQLRQASIALEPDAVALRLRRAGVWLGARVAIVPAPGRPFALEGREVTVAGLPLPGPLARWLVRSFDPSRRLGQRLPFRLEVGRIAVGPDAIRVGG